jgi:PAS domain-containing protein
VDRAAYDDETRVRLEEALKESEQRFERLVEAAKDYAIFMVDAEGFVTTWNEGGPARFRLRRRGDRRRGRFRALHARGPQERQTRA